jgi:hypothetical protein
VYNKTVLETSQALDLLNKCFEFVAVKRFQKRMRDHVCRLRKKCEDDMSSSREY